MGDDDVTGLLADLQEETARLRDPGGWTFVGGDAEADERAAEALEAQLDGVGALRAQLGSDAGAKAVVDDYQAAVAAGLARVRSGRATPLPERSAAPVTGTGDDTDAGGSRPGAGAAPGPAPELAPPSKRLTLLVAALVIMLAVAVVSVVLLLG